MQCYIVLSTKNVKIWHTASNKTNKRLKHAIAQSIPRDKVYCESTVQALASTFMLTDESGGCASQILSGLAFCPHLLQTLAASAAPFFA